MPRKFYTLDDLYQFCKANNFEHFSSKESGAPLVVQALGTFEVQDEDHQGLIPVSLRVCHTALNRNGSFISENVMKERLSTLYNRPILGYIHETSEGWDFYDHRMSIVEDGDDVRVEYDERPIGIFPESCEPHFEYDADEDKTYVVAKGLIYADYGNRAYEIIKSKGGSTKVSAEICVLEMSFNAKENYLSIDDFYFSGCTCLGKAPDGTPIEEGMKGSKLSLADFSVSNSMFGAQTNYQKLLVDTLEKLNTTLSSFSYKNLKKGGGEAVNKFDELLEKYGKTVEDIDFEIEGLTDEELEAKFQEVFGELDVATEDDVVTETPDTDEASAFVSSEDGAVVVEEPVTEEAAVVDTEPVAENEMFEKTFSVSISHEEIATSLYNLIRQYEEADDESYYISRVYDNYFIMRGWFNGKLYKQSYTVDGENVALEGDRQEVFEIIVTESEKLALDKLRNDYSVLEAKYNELDEFKKNYDAAQLKAQKEAVLAKAEYDCLKDEAGFQNLVDEMDNYSVEELSVQADLVFAAHIKSAGTFSARGEAKKDVKVVGVPFNVKEAKKSRYGNLFSSKK